MNDDPVDEIQKEMDRRGLSPADLERLGFPSDTLSLIRRKLVSPTWRTVQRVANALGCTAYVVFRRKK